MSKQVKRGHTKAPTKVHNSDQSNTQQSLLSFDRHHQSSSMVSISSKSPRAAFGGGGGGDNGLCDAQTVSALVRVLYGIAIGVLLMVLVGLSSSAGGGGGGGDEFPKRYDRPTFELPTTTTTTTNNIHPLLRRLL
ncbi:MAG: hypothetical protein HC944_06130 [Nanoarchaeota archaeon]|nr:hypothetical protein [Nanoarchaeota archaeon]